MREARRRQVWPVEVGSSVGGDTGGGLDFQARAELAQSRYPGIEKRQRREALYARTRSSVFVPWPEIARAERPTLVRIDGIVRVLGRRPYLRDTCKTKVPIARSSTSSKDMGRDRGLDLKSSASSAPGRVLVPGSHATSVKKDGLSGRMKGWANPAVLAPACSVRGLCAAADCTARGNRSGWPGNGMSSKSR